MKLPSLKRSAAFRTQVVRSSGIINNDETSRLGAWIPIGSTSALKDLCPTRVEVLGTNLVVWQSNKAWSVLADVCAHRLSPLSQGRVRKFCDQSKELPMELIFSFIGKSADKLHWMPIPRMEFQYKRRVHKNSAAWIEPIYSQGIKCSFSWYKSHRRHIVGFFWWHFNFEINYHLFSRWCIMWWAITKK